MYVNKRRKIISIVGARPQFIKAAPLNYELNKYFNLITLHTGQHYDNNLSKIFFKQFNLKKPDYNLHIGSESHASQTAKMLIGIEKVLRIEQPTFVMVYGDTNSTIAGALAAAKMQIPVVHIEAGMRSFNRSMPEELNRITTDHLSTINFCVTKVAVKNLMNEGIKKGVFLVGDAMYDIYKKMVGKINSRLLKKLKILPYSYIFVTIHRPINTDNQSNLKKIIAALLKSNQTIVFPLHPRTKKFLKKWGLMEKINRSKKIIIIPPQGYEENLSLMKYSKKIVTDSGGIQKEAYFLKKHCLTLRQETEWMETLTGGWNLLVGHPYKTLTDQILKNVKTPNKHLKVFGDGKSSKKIAQSLKKFWERRR